MRVVRVDVYNVPLSVIDPSAYKRAFKHYFVQANHLYPIVLQKLDSH